MRFAAVLAATALTVPALAQAADTHTGRNLAATCAGCHGTTGNAATGMPSIAGQSREALLRSLRDFRDGKRPATVMHQLTKGYSDAQLDLIAAHVAGQK